MPEINSRQLLALAIFGFVAAQVCPSVAADGIGSTSTIRNRVEGIIGGDTRILAAGSEIFQNELLRTGQASDVKLIFLDDTNLSVGPRSEVTLDRFVYDPDRSAGAVVVRANRGIFRFVTGSQRPQNYLIATPIATIGVRGTIFDLLVEPDRVVVILISGQIDVTTLQNRRVSLVQPGTSLTVYANGRVVGPVVWRGTIRVDFAAAEFPYFPPVRNAAKPSAPVVRTATTSTQTNDTPRRRHRGYTVSSKEYDTDTPRRRRHRFNAYPSEAKDHVRVTKQHVYRGEHRRDRPNRRRY